MWTLTGTARHERLGCAWERRERSTLREDRSEAIEQSALRRREEAWVARGVC